ncbi:uncharacterized protein LOC124846694 [Vigna umbellata]|uniref:uncharacterized protein LOC124846694 n=1 Tax=Vigna umbellata TaxID=87088 RepID=UPI001F5ECC70|nr:uncharacterized protein LOC124846694 [Vigna umbellata]
MALWLIVVRDDSNGGGSTLCLTGRKNDVVRVDDMKKQRIEEEDESACLRAEEDDDEQISGAAASVGPRLLLDGTVEEMMDWSGERSGWWWVKDHGPCSDSAFVMHVLIGWRHCDPSGRRCVKVVEIAKLLDRCGSYERMGPEAFINLCERLRSTGLVKDAIQSTVEEQVAKFLHIIGHNVKNRSVAFFFHRSGNEVHPHVLNNNRFYSYFKDCLGAIDGTHVRVRVPKSKAPRFRGRKDWPTQNVFAACDFDMKLTYVLAGWEGTASDSRILKNALDRDDLLVIPQGKYYLGDAGFMLKSTILTPYRGVRYHLKEYTRRGPQNARELFNHRHSSLRNVIERTFGVLKKRFPIITSGTEPHYGLETMTNIILACCILHNFLRGMDHDDSLLDEVDNELNEREQHDVSSSQVREEDHRIGSSIRDSIADHMWRDYQNS